MRILIAEDEAVARKKLERLLQGWGYEVLSVADGDAAWSALQREDAPSLVVLDWMMPGLDGVDVCRNVRGLTDRPYVYIVLVTQKGTDEDVVRGLDAGADDYLAKPVHASELYARLRAGRRVLEMQDELIRMREELRRQALYDMLTGTLNRRGGLAALDRELARARRKGTSLAVGVCDLDHFKAVNDVHGHAAGDDVLRESCARLAGVLRPYDTLSRHGGEEFLLILPDCAPDAARDIGERCRARLAADAVPSGAGPLPISASFGICVGDVGPGVSADHLIAVADAALYRAKRAGRDRVEIAAPAERVEGGGAGGETAESPPSP